MNTNDAVWKIYTEVREEENHFNKLQADYRKLAATWSLALFAAVAFFLFPEETPEGGGAAGGIGDPTWLVVVGAVHLLGVCMLFVMDIVVYHRLLLAAFYVGELLEEQFEWLPPMRAAMRDLTSGRVMRGVRAYYALAGALGGSIAATFGSRVWFGSALECVPTGLLIVASFTGIGCLLYWVMGWQQVGANEEKLKEEFRERVCKTRPARSEKIGKID